MGENDTEMASGAQMRSMKENMKKANSKQQELEAKFNNVEGVYSNKVKQMQDDLLAVRDVIIKHLSYENRSLRDRISTLEMRVTQIERTLNNNSQNSRKNNLEFAGIPISVPHTNLEDTVVNILNNLPEPVVCSTDDFEAVHLISRKSNATKIKTKSRKLTENIKKAKKSFNKIKMKILVSIKIPKFMLMKICAPI